MTLDENLNLLNDTKKRIKASLDNKVPQSTDNKPFGEYYTIVDGIEQFSTNIEDYTVADCVKLADITDTSIKSVNQYTKSVNIPTTVTKLGNSCFKDCSSLTSVTIPDSVTSLGNDCFNYCSGLSAVTIPNGVTSIGEYCFGNCSSLSSVTIGNSVTSLGEGCFYNSVNLTSVNIPDSVTSLGKYCFNYCSSLTGITIPDSVTSLGDSCFNSCSSLSAVTIGNSVTSIGNTCFRACSSLTSVTCKATTPPTLGSDAFGNTHTAIYVPAESVDAYKSATNWSNYADKIQAISS